MDHPGNSKDSPRLHGKYYILQQLAEQPRGTLSQALFTLNKSLFSNLSHEAFMKLLFENGAQKSHLSVCYNESDEMVGYFALHVFRMAILGKSSLVFRSQTGILPPYRRKTGNIYFLIVLILWYRIRFPFTPIYCFMVMVNPGIFKTLSGVLNQIIPAAGKLPSGKDMKLIRNFKTSFGYQDTPGSGFWVTDIGVYPRISPSEKLYWETSQDPFISFYRKLNPKLLQGKGLLAVIPFSWKNILLSSFKVMRYLIIRNSRQRNYLNPRK